MTIELTTPVGRLVSGHPMEQNQVTKKIDGVKVPQFWPDKTPTMKTYVGIAILKGAETEWKQTAWGQQMVLAAQAGWPSGEFNAPTFAWKMDDGDSPVPNKNGVKPCDREGWPGHWIIHASTNYNTPSYHAGKVKPHEAIKNKNEIKRGDYCRLVIGVVGNNPSESPGNYVNLCLFELTRAGQLIVGGGGPDASEAFATAGVMPANALVDTAVAAPVGNVPAVATATIPAGSTVTPTSAPVTTPVTPATDLVTPGHAAPPPAAPAPAVVAEPKYMTPEGNAFTRAELLAFPGWTDAHVDALPLV